MTAQLPVGPHETSSRIRSDSVFETGKITLNGDSGEALIINNNSSLISTGSGQFSTLGVTGQLTVNNIILTDEQNNTMVVGDPTHTVNRSFPDLGTTTYTTNIGLGITYGMVIADAINELESWNDAYLIDTPPPVIYVDSGTENNDSLFVEWTFHPTVGAGFADINLPHHNTVVVQYVKSSLNGSGDFSDPSTVTVDTGSKDTTKIQIFTDTGTSGLNGTTYEEYGNLDASTNYDIRVYLTNYNTTRENKYLVIEDLATEAIGVPSAPKNPQATIDRIEEIGTTWEKPDDHNIVALGNNTQPFIERYEISYTATASDRYYGLIADSGTQSTPTEVGQNADTNLDVINLNPGTTYSMDIVAYNSKNVNPSASVNITGFSDYPTPPSRIDNSTILTFPSAVYAPFTNGGYTLDGATLFNSIVNYNNLDGTLDNQELQIQTTSKILLNEIPGASAPNPGANITVYGGIQGSLENISRDFEPYVVSFDPTTEVNGTDIVLGITQNNDAYINDDPKRRGFWRATELYVRGDKNTIFKPTDDIYEFYFEETIYASPSVTTTQSQSLVFAIDDLNVSPTLSGIGIYDIEGTTPVTYISGVPTYNSNTEFLASIVISNIGNNYLRNDKLHAQLELTDITTEISPPRTIGFDDIDATNRYYDLEVNGPYVKSTILHNTTGLVLSSTDDFNPRTDIKLQDFEVTIGTTENVYTEDLRVKAIGYSLYGESSPTIATGFTESGGTPTFQNMRMDLNSINNDRSSSPTTDLYGQHVRSGGQFPNIVDTDFGQSYDHTKNILTDGDYNEELQLVNGKFYSPGSSNSFNDYSNYFYPASLSVTTPDYSTVSSGYRYATFKFTRSFTGFKNKVKITLINQTGFTVDFSTLNETNHRLYLRVVDPRTLNPGDYTFETNWLNACIAFDCMGVTNAPNDSGCLVTQNSNVNERECILQPFTQEAIFYIKVGIDSTDTHSIENIQLDVL